MLRPRHEITRLCGQSRRYKLTAHLQMLETSKLISPIMCLYSQIPTNHRRFPLCHSTIMHVFDITILAVSVIVKRLIVTIIARVIMLIFFFPLS
jgi:hypothetical protein